MAERKKRVTSLDVARAAGVSANTVSLVVRNSDLVAPDTKERVREIIARLGYRPHAAAAALRSDRAHALGYLVPEVTQAVQDVFRHQLLSAMVTSAHIASHQLLIDTFVDAPGSASLLSAGRIDGALVDWVVSDEVLEQLIKQNAPVVLVGRETSLPVSWVKADERGGALQATRQLLELGHQRFALITGGNAHTNAIVRERVEGFEQALGEVNIPLDGTRTVNGDWTYASGLALGMHLLEQRPRSTAIFALNELMAVGVLQAARVQGLTVPHDFSVVTVEDSPWVEYVRPQLTAVHVPMYEVGRRATEMVLALLDTADSGPRTEVLPTTFVVRESSGRARENASERVDQ